jgi:hypothetical protein
MGHDSAHYTMRDFLSSHENLIFYSEKKPQQEFIFEGIDFA